MNVCENEREICERAREREFNREILSLIKRFQYESCPSLKTVWLYALLVLIIVTNS